MTKVKNVYIPNERYSKEDWDAVDSPVATDEQLALARPFAEVFPQLADAMRRNVGGRPKTDAPKVPVSIRLDLDLLEHYKATGKGWQGRMNDDLRKVVGL